VQNLLIDLRDLGYDDETARVEVQDLVGADLGTLVAEPSGGDPVGHQLRQWEPLIATASAVARGQADPQTATQVDSTLSQLEAQDDWAALVPVLRAIISNAAATDLGGLDAINTAIATELHRRVLDEID
jgi:hypothetical protein